MIDVPLLRKSLEFVTRHPEDWRQVFWITSSLVVDGETYTKQDAITKWYSLTDEEQQQEATWCGTTACLAGHVATTILGGEPYFRGDNLVTASMVRINDRVELVANVATDALGLTDHQAERLFSPTNDLATLWALANEFTDGEIEIPLQFL